MPQVVPARSLELHEVEAQFGLQQAMDPAFFLEWQNVKIELDERVGKASPPGESLLAR